MTSATASATLPWLSPTDIPKDDLAPPPLLNGPGNMSQSIQCPSCRVTLNLPDTAVGRRLKCPKCGVKFQVGGGGGTHHPPSAGPAPQKTPEPSAESTLVLTKTYSSGVDLPPMPTAAGNLRETFDLPLMREAALASRNGQAPPSRGRETADALTLFDDRPAAPKKRVGAEARATTRRCPTCGGVVSVGMSLCQCCGLDLETGDRVSLVEEFVPPTPPRPEGVPAPIAVVGFLSLAASVAAAFLALMKWTQGVSGAFYFIPVAGFGIYAAIQFLRCKTPKLLLVALTLGAAIDLAALVGLPVYYAMTDVTIEVRTTTSEDPDAPSEVVRPPSERLDMPQVTLGIILLGVYAATSIYILSPSVQRHFRS